MSPYVQRRTADAIAKAALALLPHIDREALNRDAKEDVRWAKRLLTNYAKRSRING